MHKPFYLSNAERFTLGRVALGKEAPDLVLRGGRYLNVYTNDLIQADIWIWKEWIAKVTLDQCPFDVPVLDVYDKILMPGFIDGHIHVESSLLDPVNFAQTALRCGVTTFVTDFHEVGSIAGAEGIREMMNAFGVSPIKAFLMTPMRLPFLPDIQNTLSTMSPEEAGRLLKDADTVGLSEVMGETVVNMLMKGSPDDLSLLTDASARRKSPEGHLFHNVGDTLDACISVGIRSDHEPRAPDEVEEKIKKGLFVMLRQGTIATEVETLIKTVVDRSLPTNRIGLVTDDILADDLTPDNYMLNKVRIAVKNGVDIIDALKMVSYNVAVHYRLEELIGAIKPGAYADIIVMNSLEDLDIEQVISSGQPIEMGQNPKATIRYSTPLLNTIPRGPLTRDDLSYLPAGYSKDTIGIRAITLNEKNRFTTIEECSVPVVEGEIVLTDDLAFLMCANRRAEDLVGLGFLKGYGLHDGALAVSIAHDHHGIIALGSTKDDLLVASNRIIELQGGIVLARQGKIAAELALPLAGLMSTAPFSKVIEALTKLHRELRAAGAKWGKPIFFVFWLGMEVAPFFRITDRGLWDTEHRTHIPCLVDPKGN